MRSQRQHRYCSRNRILHTNSLRTGTQEERCPHESRRVNALLLRLLDMLRCRFQMRLHTRGGGLSAAGDLRFPCNFCISPSQQLDLSVAGNKRRAIVGVPSCRNERAGSRLKRLVKLASSLLINIRFLGRAAPHGCGHANICASVALRRHCDARRSAQYSARTYKGKPIERWGRKASGLRAAA